MTGDDELPENVVDLFARRDAVVAWERRATEDLVVEFEKQLADLPSEARDGRVATMLEATVVLMRHGLASDDPAVLQRMGRAMRWVTAGGTTGS